MLGVQRSLQTEDCISTIQHISQFVLKEIYFNYPRPLTEVSVVRRFVVKLVTSGGFNFNFNFI